MNAHAQHIAIATICSFYVYEHEETGAFRLGNRNHFSQYPWRGSANLAWADAPKYLTDLNAMHEAEKVLSHRDRQEYACRIFELPGPFAAAFATPVQRAEAFLRAVGKWEDGT